MTILSYTCLGPGCHQENDQAFMGHRSICVDFLVLCGNETEQDPVGLLGTEAFLCPPYLVCREQTPASMTFPELQRADSNSCSSGKGGDAETTEEQSRNNSAALGQGPGSTSRDTHNNIFKLFIELKPPMEDVAFFIPEKTT